MIDANVPGLRSLWIGTGTVIVPVWTALCIILWLPRCLTAMNPFSSSSLHIYSPENFLRLGIFGFKLSNPSLAAQTPIDFIGRCALQKKSHRFTKAGQSLLWRRALARNIQFWI